MIIAALVFFAALSIYLAIVRPLLAKQPALSNAFKAEASFWEQLRTKLVGWKTKIASRLVVISGLVVALYDQALPYFAGQDWSPITAKLPSWALPLGMVGLGLLFDYLRHVTANPPTVIVQADDSGERKVVDLIKPAA